MNHLDQKANNEYGRFLNVVALDDVGCIIRAVKVLRCYTEGILPSSNQKSPLEIIAQDKHYSSSVDRKHLEAPFLRE